MPQDAESSKPDIAPPSEVEVIKRSISVGLSDGEIPPDLLPRSLPVPPPL